MMHFSKERFQQFILDNHVIGFFENAITLKSGRQSNWYVDWRSVTSDAFLLDQLTDFLVNYLHDFVPDCTTLFGVPEGATKTAIITQLKWAKAHHCKKGSHVVAMGRAQPKQHGAVKDKFFIGKPYGNVVVLEDTTTTGLSLIQTIDTLLDAHVNVNMAISLTYRSEKRDDGFSVPDDFKKRYANKIAFVALSEAIDLLPIVIAEHLPDLSIIKSIEKEFMQYGTRPLELK